MATIPMGNFGQQVAGAAPSVNYQTGAPVGAAIADTGALVSRAGAQLGELQIQQREQQQRATSALALAKTQNAMHAEHDAVSRAVLDGSLDPDKAPGELQTRLAKVRQDGVGGLIPEQQQQVDAHLEGTAGSLQRSLVGVVQKRQQTDAAGTIDQFGEQVSREGMRQGPAWATQKYGAMVDFYGGAAGLNEKDQAKLKQGFTEKVHHDFFAQAGAGALAHGDVQALQNLRDQLDGPQGDPIDPKQRAILTHTLYGWQQHLLAQQDRAANQAETEKTRAYNAAADVFNKGTDIALGGGYFSPDFIQELTTTSAGTPMEKPVANLIASQRAVAGFASRPADQRAAMIERARSERATPGQGTDPLSDKLLGAMTTMDEKLRRQADENPWAAAQSAGVIKDAPVFNLADPGTAVQAIQQRMQQIGAVEAWTGKRASPLQPAEVDQLSKFVRQLPLDQAASMLSSIGGALGNDERVAALGKQLHDKDGTLGLAMMYASAQTTEGRKTAELVLRGEQALKDSTALVDKAKDTGWQGTIAKAIRGAYSNREAEDQVIDAAFKITAAQYAAGQGVDTDRAIRLATGGIIERNGQKVPLPYGMSESDFNKRLAAITPDALSAQAPGGQVFVGRTPMSLADFVATLPKATLVHAGQGAYNVRAGTSLVTNDKGQRITLRVSP